ncbi:MFS transporter [Methyloligella sp. 2.7D]|uniref:MFS transporter n=1 Tax=unclassified Methyloligella TaxID=2625955 RepID=UPI00157CAFFC|nr:MFS transporter [Methyloligella sp. GL2]QKP78405.1 MFS transporter [Methyloligella sp. GL2]
MIFGAFKGWTKSQRHALIASYLGWTLDAFDFFLLIFVMVDVAEEFGVSVETVTWAVTLTLAMRPIGALLFGRLADRYGRRPVLMANVLAFSILGFATAFSPDLIVFLILRALFGIAMGGEWGVGASLTMESIPVKSRGVASGLLQAGYPSGYLLAAVVYALLYDVIGWRGMFIVGALPALLVLYIRSFVAESPAWSSQGPGAARMLDVLRKHWSLALYAMVFMMGMAFFSHGTQDLYPTFLKLDRGLDPQAIGIIAVIYNIGAILGGLIFGALSQAIGRRYALALGAGLALLITPFWAMADGVVMLAVAAFAMQFMVQGCWGIVPAHLNEISPAEVRGTFPGFVYQLGNLLASYNATMQAGIASRYGSYGIALALVAAGAAITVGLLALAGREAKEIDMAYAEEEGG